jgi:hypothetical protein
VGSDITIPRFYRWIIKYVTPAFLLIILAVYAIQDGIPLLLLRNIKPENLLPVLMTRIVLVLLFALLALMVWLAWRRKTGPAQEAPP